MNEGFMSLKLIPLLVTTDMEHVIVNCLSDYVKPLELNFHLHISYKSGIKYSFSNTATNYMKKSYSGELIYSINTHPIENVCSVMCVLPG